MKTENKTKILCKFCGNYHLIPPNGYHVQKRLSQLLSTKPKIVYRGLEFEKTQSLIDEIKATINKFYTSISDLKNLIRTHCDELREQIEKDNKAAIDEHEAIMQKLMNEMDKYEKKCFENLQFESHLQVNYSHFLSEASKKTEDWSSRLTRADITKNDIEALYNEALNLKISILSEAKTLKSLFHGKILNYHEHENEPNSAHFGRLEEAPFDFLRPEGKRKQVQSKHHKKTKHLNDDVREMSSLLTLPIFHACNSICNFWFDGIEDVYDAVSTVRLQMFVKIFGYH
jgi:hypothetical protein